MECSPNLLPSTATASLGMVTFVILNCCGLISFSDDDDSGGEVLVYWYLKWRMEVFTIEELKLSKVGDTLSTHINVFFLSGLQIHLKQCNRSAMLMIFNKLLPILILEVTAMAQKTYIICILNIYCMLKLSRNYTTLKSKFSSLIEHPYHYTLD